MKLGSKVTKIIFISRPRFWLYLAGTFLLGSVIGVGKIQDLLSLQFLLNFIYFLVPANIFLYGINDIYDEDTDKFNEKKISKEHFLLKSEKKFIKKALALCLVTTFLIILIQKPSIAPLFLIFIFLSWAYSSPPFRLKARPFADSTSNILYAIPGFIGYLQFRDYTSGFFIVFFLALCWTSAMHLFSAIPDIVPDSKAKIKTTAVLLGSKVSLSLCIGLWSAFLTLLLKSGFIYPYSLIAAVYVIIPFFLIFNTNNIAGIYWYFPYINALLGFGATIIVLLQKI